VAYARKQGTVVASGLVTHALPTAQAAGRPVDAASRRVPDRVVALDDPLGRIAAHGVGSWLHRRDGAGHAAREAVTT
jgi:hypothetical protein